MAVCVPNMAILVPNMTVNVHNRNVFEIHLYLWTNGYLHISIKFVPLGQQQLVREQLV